MFLDILEFRIYHNCLGKTVLKMWSQICGKKSICVHKTTYCAHYTQDNTLCTLYKLRTVHTTHTRQHTVYTLKTTHCAHYTQDSTLCTLHKQQWIVQSAHKAVHCTQGLLCVCCALYIYYDCSRRSLSALHYTTLHNSVKHYTAPHYTTIHYTTLR